MTDENPLSYEQAQAWSVLDLATTHITDDVTKRSAWLLTAVGAALTFVISNAASVSTLIDTGSVRMSLTLLAASMLCGLAAQVLGSSAKSALLMARAMLQVASTHHNAEAFFQSVLSGLNWSVRRRALRQAKRPNPSGFMSLVYIPARLSQRQSAWCFVQLSFAIAAVFVVALGVKA